MQSIIHCFYSYQSMLLKMNTVLMKNTNTNKKKWNQKNIFLEKLFLYFYFFVRSEHSNTNKRWLSSRKIQKDMFVWWLELYEENSIIDWELKNQEIFIIVVAVKEIDSIDHKETILQMHSIIKEVLFIVNNDKMRSQDKNKQQLNDFLTESWTSWVHSVIFISYALLWVLFYEKKLIRLNKVNRTTFLSTNNRILFSWKIFHQMDILCEIEMNGKLSNERIWRVYQKYQWRNHWKKITEKMNE